jgi:hypothetical protein
MFARTLTYPASAIAGKHRLTADDVMLLRRHMFPQGLQFLDDAAQLIAVHKSAAETTREWDTWFVEAVAAFVVTRTDPRDALDTSNAGFLIENLSKGGVIETQAELELLLHAMEMAVDVPDVLTVLALDQLRLAMQTGKGVYSDRRMAKRAGISQCDIDFIYRILRGSVHNGKMVLYPSEIAVIEAIDAIVRDEINHPAWYYLIKSIAVRDQDGHASAEPWLKMVSSDTNDYEAA